ncbi:DUF6505 family protein [Salinarimonas soli]|uniref:Uncharacterized protein n=1 Tax=Salinarimonas soli TaxID=1638099 RepID=A0A5B2VG79_9HYPH|nr:DUF6505 family protein [Salinarimonas soli]KAA2237157.1 hypothetical protein F0L46_09070 [Salinarimonas soli]
MTLRLPRTIRLDPSDTLVFAHAAEPGEWAVTGSFLFLDADPAALAGKERAAFRAGFAGVASLGFSTLVVVTDATPAEFEEAVETLARHIHARFGAPDMDAARGAAREEVAFAASLCDHPAGTLLALHRTVEDGEVRERFRTLRARDENAPGADRLHAHTRPFLVVETDEPEESVDLLGLMETKR